MPVAGQMIETWNRGMSVMDPFEENENVGSLNIEMELPEVRLPLAFIQLFVLFMTKLFVFYARTFLISSYLNHLEISFWVIFCLSYLFFNFSYSLKIFSDSPSEKYSFKRISKISLSSLVSQSFEIYNIYSSLLI